MPKLIPSCKEHNNLVVNESYDTKRFHFLGTNRDNDRYEWHAEPFPSCARHSQISSTDPARFLVANYVYRMAAIEGHFGEPLVSVRAIVMAWDEKYGGWQPLDGGGISNVILYRCMVAGEYEPREQLEPGPSHQEQELIQPVYEYTIRAERLEDRQITLHCELTRDVFYRQAMPTFHHWQVNDHKYGLKFMSSHDGTKFHDHLQTAIDQLIQQTVPSPEEPAERGIEEVFMSLDLPLSQTESMASRAVTPTSEVVAALIHQPPERSVIPKKASAVSATGVPSEGIGVRLAAGRTPTWPKTPEPSVVAKARPYPQVHFRKHTTTFTAYAKTPEMRSAVSTPGPSMYVQLGSQATRMEKRGSTPSLKLPLTYHHLPPPAPPRGVLRTRGGPGEMSRPERCLYCRSVYTERDNRRGSCPRAPDTCYQCIRKATCLWCAECVLLGCCRNWTDAEGVSEADVCSCSPDVPLRARRWTVLAILTLCVPCLCLYPPLAACHRRCRRRGWFGGRHRPSSSTLSSGSGGRSSSVRLHTPET